MLELMAAKPALAQIVMGEAVSVEPAVVARYRQLLIPALRELWGTAEQADAHTDPRLAFGRAQVLIYNQVLAGSVERLPELLPEIVYIAILPFAGHEAALAEARLAGGESSQLGDR